MLFRSRISSDGDSSSIVRVGLFRVSPLRLMAREDCEAQLVGRYVQRGLQQDQLTATVLRDSGFASAFTDSVAQRMIVSGEACHIPFENFTMVTRTYEET